MNDEDAVEDDHRGPDITTEELWEAALTAASAPTIGPTIGPPVAGFFAAYDPLTGAPHDVSGKGDLYGFEAQGNRIPVSLGALPGRFAGVHTTVLTGGPFRFEPVERITVLVSDFHPRYGTTMHVSRDRFGTPPDEEDQLVQCFTHFVLDEMRKAYANPISLEPIYLFKPGFDRMHAFTRGPLEPAQLLTPEQRLRAETSQTHFDVCLAELTAANAAYDAAAVAERSRVRAEGGVRPRDLEEHVRANPSEDMDAALLRIELAYQALEAASTRLFRDRPLAHPERAAISVSQAWYSDRAVPFPTFLETRDDEQYFRKSIVDGARRPVLARLQTLHGDQALLQALANADVPANAPDRDLEVLEEAERLFHTVGKAINLLNT